MEISGGMREIGSSKPLEILHCWPLILKFVQIQNEIILTSLMDRIIKELICCHRNYMRMPVVL